MIGSMESYDNRQLRMTVWPGAPLPLPPPLPRRSKYRLDRTGLGLVGTGAREEIEQAERREIYLELHRVDLDDPEAILSFASRFGRLSGWPLFEALNPHKWFKGLFSPAQDRRQLETVWKADPIDWKTADTETLSSFRFAARVLRDLTDAYRIISAQSQRGRVPHTWCLPYRIDEPDRDERAIAAALLSAGLTRLLADIRPYVLPWPSPFIEQVRQPRGRIRPTEHRDAMLEAAPAPTIGFGLPLGKFCALELFNHMVGQEVYRVCQNETCGRFFIRQYGRAEHGMSKRQGVMYCSTHCAQAKAARAYRARKKAGITKTRPKRQTR
jgi:hypothetical protein